MVEKLLATGFVLLTLVWAGCWVYNNNWWTENLLSLPGLFFYLYLVIAALSFIIRLHLLGVIALGTGAFFYAFAPPEQAETTQECSDALTIVQYNLAFENQNLGQFIEYLKQERPDLIVMQEVSPEHGEQFDVLFKLYPYRFGGQPKVGYPSNQLILSRELLYGLNLYEAPYGGKLIRGVWQPRIGLDIATYFAHPPSPRTEILWYQRNSMIATIQEFAARSATKHNLIMGDFNLSSTTPRYASLFPQYEDEPVLSWAAFDLLGLEVPLMASAIDHLWYQGDADSAICERRTLREIQGSDHYPVLTKLYVGP